MRSMQSHPSETMTNRLDPAATAVTEPTTGLYRLAAVAALCGMSPALYEAAAVRGEVPEVLHIGPRGLRFVRALDLNRFLNGEPWK
ncbi:hypothetical protein Tharo_2644 [Thauera aromatica K172]|uniref:Helix-turn-helix domain-containing protein n=2 Tax=Thauera aromatica TaxID=59405 RepID=A0A2R4BQP7_THAAR|nr:hypothetical protein Tharo_2644 [Thauera aromatica K172]